MYINQIILKPSSHCWARSPKREKQNIYIPMTTDRRSSADGDSVTQLKALTLFVDCWLVENEESKSNFL